MATLGRGRCLDPSGRVVGAVTVLDRADHDLAQRDDPALPRRGRPARVAQLGQVGAHHVAADLVHSLVRPLAAELAGVGPVPRAGRRRVAGAALGPRLGVGSEAGPVVGAPLHGRALLGRDGVHRTLAGLGPVERVGEPVEGAGLAAAADRGPGNSPPAAGAQCFWLLGHGGVASHSERTRGPAEGAP